MMPAGAAQGYGQAVLAFLNVEGNQPLDNLHEPVYKLLGNILFQHILRNLLVVARKGFQAGNIVRIRDKSHIQRPVSLRRNSVFVAKGHEVQREGVACLPFRKQPVKLRIHLRYL